MPPLPPLRLPRPKSGGPPGSSGPVLILGALGRWPAFAIQQKQSGEALLLPPSSCVRGGRVVFPSSGIHVPGRRVPPDRGALSPGSGPCSEALSGGKWMTWRVRGHL